MKLFDILINNSIAVVSVILTIIFFILCLIKHRKLKQCEAEYDALDNQYSVVLGESMKYELEYEMLKEQYNREKDQSEQIQKLHENTRRLKHDMKNHILVANSYLNAKEYSEAKEYLSQILDQLNQTYTYIETGNSILNYIINTKLEYAKQNGIAVKAEIENIPFKIMGSLDFSSLLSNILDNAIEASVLSSNKELHVYILRKRAYDTILVKNKIDKSVLDSNSQLKSSKHFDDKHGYGIKQIRSIVQKYDGMMDIYEQDGMFCVYVMILAEASE